MDNWIESKNALPVVGEYVLVLLEGETMLKGRLCSNGWSAFFADGEKLVGTRDVTHWTYLPSLPGKTNEPANDVHAFPVLSKRELIATHIDVSKDMENWSVAFFNDLMGSKPPTNQLENYKWWANAEAKIRLIKADALLFELSTPQP